jgi:hypothetical protein
MPLPSPIHRWIRPKVAAALAAAFETPGRRQLLWSASISYPNFSSTAGMIANGFGNTSPTSSGELVMTNSTQDEARSRHRLEPVAR